MAKSQHTPGAAGAGRRAGARALLLAAAAGLGTLALAAAGVAVADEGTADVDRARTVLEKWVETRRLISRERRDWALGREMLQDRIDVVEHEIESRREKIRDAEQSIGEADRQLAELVAKNDRHKEASATLDELITGLEQRTQALLPRLPEPIRERVKPLSQKLPEDPRDTKLSLGERFQNVVGILNEVNKFNREITVTSEVRALPDGTSAEVTALYLGVSCGYYVGANGRVAGVGSPSANGWTWTPADGSAAAVARAVAILKNEEVADFVPLPVRIDGQGAAP